MHQVVLSCEHAGNDIPEAYTHCFDTVAARAALATHRGWDPGAREIAAEFARALERPLLEQPVSRLLVECNRSIGHRALWSEFSARLSEPERDEVLDRYWRPHRDAVRRAVESAPTHAVVVHLGVHTFTPVWKGKSRGTDIGILYDHRREGEARLAAAWRARLVRLRAPLGLRVHRNRPYRGWTDGLVTTLRGEYPPDRYVGIELEVAQGLIARSDGPGALLDLVASFSEAVGAEFA